MPGSMIDSLEKQIEQKNKELKVVETKLKQLQVTIQQASGMEHLELIPQNFNEHKSIDLQQQSLKKALQSLPAYQQYLSYRNYYVELFQEQYKLIQKLIKERYTEEKPSLQHFLKHIEQGCPCSCEICVFIQEHGMSSSCIMPTPPSLINVVPQPKKIIKKYE